MSMRKILNQEPTGTVFDEQERQKILRINREIRETPQEPRLEWIYTGDRAQSEDFLLGKKFDGDTKSNIPAAADGFAAENTTTSTIDLANKIREDPLFLIKKKEIEQRKRILENPVRLKQLRDLLERQESGQSSSPPRKRKHQHSRSPSPPARQRNRSPPAPARRRHSRSPPPASRRRLPTPPASRRRSPTPPSRYRRQHTPPPRSPPRRQRTPSPRSPPRRRRTPPPVSRAPQRSEKPSREERERRIREMLVDGAVRNEQRQKNVRLYKERDEQEEQANERLRQRPKKKKTNNNDSSSENDDEHDFIQPMMKQVVDDPNLRRRDLKHHHHHKRQ